MLTNKLNELIINITFNYVIYYYLYYLYMQIINNVQYTVCCYNEWITFYYQGLK